MLFSHSPRRSPKLLWTIALLCWSGSLLAQAPVFTAEVREQPFVETLEGLGTLRANEAVTLTATVTDTVRSITFQDGQRVRAGDVLVAMTNAEETADLNAAEAALTEADNQLKRVQSLVRSKLANQALLDERRQAFQSAEARLAGMRARLADRLIVAPFDGVVGLRNLSVGSLVTPGTAITTLDDDAVMKLDITLPSVYLSSVAVGLPITATTWDLQGEAFEGTVSSVGSRIDPITRSVVVRAELPNPERRLRPGMLMTVRLQSAPQPRLVVPEEAIVQEGFNQYVYRLDSGAEPAVVRKRKVTTGSRQQGRVVVTNGLVAGDRIVAQGIMRLTDGAAVTVAGNVDDKTVPALLRAGGAAGARR